MSNSARRKIVEMHAEIDQLRAENASLKAELAVAQEELHFQACLTRDLLPYQERAIKSEQQLAAALAACAELTDAYITVNPHHSGALRKFAEAIRGLKCEQ